MGNFLLSSANNAKVTGSGKITISCKFYLAAINAIHLIYWYWI